MADPRRDIYLLNDVVGPGQSAPPELLNTRITGEFLRPTTVRDMLVTTAHGSTYLLSKIPTGGFQVLQLPILQGSPTGPVPVAQWKAIMYGCSIIPLSVLMAASSAGDTMAPEARNWLYNNGWQVRRRANLNVPANPGESDWKGWEPAPSVEQ